LAKYISMWLLAEGTVIISGYLLSILFFSHVELGQE
jgi:hypothetical protein